MGIRGWWPRWIGTRAIGRGAISLCSRSTLSKSSILRRECVSLQVVGCGEGFRWFRQTRGKEKEVVGRLASKIEEGLDEVGRRLLLSRFPSTCVSLFLILRTWDGRLKRERLGSFGFLSFFFFFCFILSFFHWRLNEGSGLTRVLLNCAKHNGTRKEVGGTGLVEIPNCYCARLQFAAIRTHRRVASFQISRRRRAIFHD